MRYHWTKSPLTVKDEAQDVSLPPGWGAHEDFLSYRRTEIHQLDDEGVLKWVGTWPFTGLTEEARGSLKRTLLLSHARLLDMPSTDEAAVTCMKEAFNGIASVLYNAEVLTRTELSNGIPRLVWQSAVAGGWWPYASQKPHFIFMERIGPYYIYRDENQNWDLLFRAEVTHWRAELLSIKAHPKLMWPASGKQNMSSDDWHDLKNRFRALILDPGNELKAINLGHQGWNFIDGSGKQQLDDEFRALAVRAGICSDPPTHRDPLDW